MISSTGWQLSFLPECVFVLFAPSPREKHGRNKWHLAPETAAQWCTMSEAGIWRTAIGGLQLWIGSTCEWGVCGEGGEAAVQWRLLTGRQQVWVKWRYLFLGCITLSVSDSTFFFFYQCTTCKAGAFLVHELWWFSLNSLLINIINALIPPVPVVRFVDLKLHF